MPLYRRNCVHLGESDVPGKNDCFKSFSAHLFHEQNDRKNLLLYVEEIPGSGHSQTDLHKIDQSTGPNLFQSGETLVDVLDCDD